MKGLALAASVVFSAAVTGFAAAEGLEPWKLRWNVHAEMFTFPPSLPFHAVPSAVEYAFTVTDDGRHVFRFKAARPDEPLTNVWARMDTGIMSVRCEGLDKDGRSVGLAGEGTWWKAAPFKPGSYPPAKRGYAAAAAMVYDYVFNLSNVQYVAAHGRPDPGYILNCYPSKTHSSLICAMVALAQANLARKDVALGLARTLADYLIANSEGPGTPLAGFPPTYESHKEYQKWTAEKYAGQTMLLYPAAAGGAYLTLYRATGERKYRDAALAIAERYLALQGEDGTWPLKLWLKDGRPVTPNRCLPTGIMGFLEDIHTETGDARCRSATDRAFAFIKRGPLRDWNWEGQFEDVEPSRKYRNLSKHPACDVAIYILRRFPKDAEKVALAREILRFAEDQFVYWERPCRPDGTGIRTVRGGYKKGDVTADYLGWLDFPSVGEQYGWYIPIDASNAKMILTYLAMYRLTGCTLDLQKARALGDTLTRVQLDSGRIPTQLAEYNLKDPGQDWVNCMLAAADALQELARLSD